MSILGRERVSDDTRNKILKKICTGILILEAVMETFVTSSTQTTSSFSCPSTRAETHNVVSLSCLSAVSR